VIEKTNISYSAMRKFQTCRKSFYFRYILRIEPLYISDALSFGKLIHACLEAYYGLENKGGMGRIITANYPNKQNDRNQAHHHALAQALWLGYAERYKDDSFKVIDTEFEFDVPIINPATGRHSKKFRLHGFIDMVTQDEQGNYWLWEHKTTADLSDSYIERIWHDQQIMLYAIAYQQMTGRKVKGIVYNAIQKVKLKQGTGETEQEFIKRRADLIAKSKTGKSSAKRKMPESDDAYLARLTDRYLTDASLFHREVILTDCLRTHEVRDELWQITQDIGQCKAYYKSRSQCHGFGLCEFFKICNSGDNPLIIENYYKEREDGTITNGEEDEEQRSF
jgi:hypothetical protein